MTQQTLDKSTLAINGGTPVRTKPFAPACFINSNERELLLQCFDSQKWSVFKGSSGGWDIKKVGKLTSKEANTYGSDEVVFLGGKYVRELEYLFAKEFSMTYAVASNSATSCLAMALGALNIGPGDEVIVPCMSFNATATSILVFNS